MNHEKYGFSLDVVIPVFNGEDWILTCVQEITDQLRLNGLKDSTVIVINDGSTDNTREVLNKLTFPNVLVVHQSNLGRLQARAKGASLSKADFILFLDTRVVLHKGSLEFVLEELSRKEITLWTCDVHPQTDGNLLARFWRVIEKLFWLSYYRDPKFSIITPENFDHFPKGTGALVSPRNLFIEASLYCEKTSNLSDQRKINDDTSILRYMVQQEKMAIAPQYSCTYYARAQFSTFLKHAFHRGAVLIDGHWRKGTRLYYPITLSLIFIPMIPVVLVAYPMTVVKGLLFAVPVLMVLLLRAIDRPIDLFVFGCLLPFFSVSYFFGMWHGLYLRAQSRFNDHG